MRTDPRPALDRLVAALEAHFLAAQRRRGEQDPAVEHAFAVLADAFETYDDALFEAFGETTPFEVYDDEDEDDDDDEDDADSDDAEDIEEADLTPDDEDDPDDDDLVDR